MVDNNACASPCRTVPIKCSSPHLWHKLSLSLFALPLYRLRPQVDVTRNISPLTSPLRMSYTPNTGHEGGLKFPSFHSKLSLQSYDIQSKCINTPHNKWQSFFFHFHASSTKSPSLNFSWQVTGIASTVSQ